MQNEELFKKIWNNVKIQMQKYIINQKFYEDFFLKVEFKKIENNNIILEAPNEFSAEVIKREFIKEIKKIFIEHTNEDLNISITYKNDSNNIKEEKIFEIKKHNENLNFKLTFENFIVGNFNKKMYTAAKEICKDGSIYNPLFIYGDTGLGKTHIINAIGIELRKKDLKVVFLNTEDFLRDTYHFLSISGKELENYKKSFEDINVLIIDDIQFLSNKEKMNEIFFNIFNFFIKNDKKIIISSDRVPNELKIDSRMISRLNSGLTIKISKPDINTINEIIKQKINRNIDNDVKFTEGSIKFIANRFNSDIRSLEGIINKILFQISLKDDENSVINEEKIKEILDIEMSNGLIGKEYKISPNIVIENIAISYGIDKNLITSKSRVKNISLARQICIYILREKMNMSYSEIGMYFSNRDHSTILESYKKIKCEIDKNIDLKNFIENIIKNI